MDNEEADFSAKAAREPEMSMALGEARLESEKISEIISILEKRLSPVIAPINEEGGDRTTQSAIGNRLVTSYVSPLAAQVDQITVKNRDNRTRLNKLIDSLEV